MNGLQIVESLAVYLNENQDVRVFKFNRIPTYSGEYIAVNHLPFTYGQVVSSDNVLNVNIHVPSRSSGNADTVRLGEIESSIKKLIPEDSGCEDETGLYLDGCYFSIASTSQPIEDTDGTYFLNLTVKVIINKLNLE